MTVVDVRHGSMQVSHGIHGIIAWQVADLAARNALIVGAGDIGRVVFLTSTGELFVLTNNVGPVWGSIASGAGGGGPGAYTGTGAPSNLLGVDGALYIRLDTADIYQKAAGSWGAAVGRLLPPYSGTDGAVLVENSLSADGKTFRKLTLDDIGPAFAISSWAKTAPNAGTLLYRRGDSLTLFTASASYSSAASSASIADTFGGSTDAINDVTNGAWAAMVAPFTAASRSGVIARFGSDLGADPTWTATLTAIAATTKTAAFTVTWTSDVYWGVGAAGINTGAGIIALGNSSLQTSRAKSFTVSPSNQKVYYAYPQERGALSGITLAGLPAAFNAPISVAVTANGVTRTYYVYESTNLLIGTSQTFTAS